MEWRNVEESCYFNSKFCSWRARIGYLTIYYETNSIQHGWHICGRLRWNYNSYCNYIYSVHSRCNDNHMWNKVSKYNTVPRPICNHNTGSGIHSEAYKANFINLYIYKLNFTYWCWNMNFRLHIFAKIFVKIYFRLARKIIRKVTKIMKVFGEYFKS
jgi:hypothetical protein